MPAGGPQEDRWRTARRNAGGPFVARIDISKICMNLEMVMPVLDDRSVVGKLRVRAFK